jgi:peptidoglycan/LPS O-acetylase OafA/YrhL
MGLAQRWTRDDPWVRLLAMRALALGASVLFLVSAALQWNDPDPVRWLLLYGCAALVCGLYALGRMPRPAALALTGIGLAWAASLAPSVIRSASFSGGEQERELAGLLLVAAVCATLGRQRATESSE